MSILFLSSSSSVLFKFLAKFSDPPPKILLIKPPTVPTALPAPMATIAPDRAKVPLATCIKLLPSTSPTAPRPDANFSNAPPINQVAAANPAPIMAIEAANDVAPRIVAGLANDANPPANPFMPAPTPPSIPPAPAPALPNILVPPLDLLPPNGR